MSPCSTRSGEYRSRPRTAVRDRRCSAAISEEVWKEKRTESKEETVQWLNMRERTKITGGEEDGQIVQETVYLFAMPSHDDRDATRLCVTQRDAYVLEDGM